MAIPVARDIDPFTVEILKDSLIAIGDEMFVALQRTSQSPIIYEVLDYCCGLTDARAQLIAQGNGVALFLGTLTFAVQEVLNKFGIDGLEEGDIFVTNDPYTGGGTHLSDVSMVMPIFFGGHVVGFAANKAHWTEVGGKDPGSWTTDSVEVFQEGLQLPNVKLFAQGQPIHDGINSVALFCCHLRTVVAQRPLQYSALIGDLGRDDAAHNLVRLFRGAILGAAQQHVAADRPFDARLKSPGAIEQDDRNPENRKRLHQRR